MRGVCVFCSSSDKVAPAYVQVAQELGQALAERNVTLIFGGCKVGLMEALARNVHRFGGRVVGVIPEAVRDQGLAYVDADELVVVRDLRERMAEMEQRSDAYLALPGGFGTLHEVAEVIAQKCLRAHTKPLVLINTRGFYTPLADLFEHLYQQGFAPEEYRNLYCVVPDVPRALAYLETYKPAAVPGPRA